MEIENQSWQIATAFFSFFVTLFAFFLIYKANVDSLAASKPKDDGIKTTSHQNGDNQAHSEPKDYGIKITSPENAQHVLGLVTVSGTYDEKPADRRLKLFLYSPNSEEYWPQKKSILCNTEQKSWSTTVHIEQNKQRDIIIATVGEAGQSLCNYYERVGEITQEWIGIKELISDIHPCDRVRVTGLPPYNTIRPTHSRQS